MSKSTKVHRYAYKDNCNDCLLIDNPNPLVSKSGYTCSNERCKVYLGDLCTDCAKKDPKEFRNNCKTCKKIFCIDCMWFDDFNNIWCRGCLEKR